MAHSAVAFSEAYRVVTDFLRSARSQSSLPKSKWIEFRSTLDRMSLSKATLDAIHLWTIENLEHHSTSHVRPRVLHELELRFVPTAAHGRLLEAQHMGMISPGQVEYLLEDLAGREVLPVSSEHMQNLIIKTWCRNFSGVKSVKVN